MRLLDLIVRSLNDRVGGDYIKLVAQAATGVLGLKVATVYNNSTTPFVAFQPLILKKGET